MADLFTVDDHGHEQRIFMRRILVAGGIVLFFTLLLFARYFFLQIMQHDYYKTLSDDNRIQLVSIAPSRGLIFDSRGVVLADNSPSFSLMIVKEQLGKGKDKLDETINALRKLVAMDDRDVAKFKTRLNERQHPFEPVALRFNLTDEEIAKVSVDSFRFPGVEIEAELIRHYPLSDHTAHSVGYVGRINESEEKELDKKNYNGTHYMGKVGVEKEYEALLHGQVGYQHIETNVHGQILRVLGKTDSVAGKNLQLYLDSRLQKIATDALGENKGAVVAMDPKTGGVLALVSTPSYDPNLFVTGISVDDYKALSDRKALYNRAMRGEYAPGSTVKPFMAIAGLDSEKIDEKLQIADPGFFQLGGVGRQYRDWKKGGHGMVDLYRAIVESCDIYFYTLAQRLTINGIDKYWSQFGLGKKTGIDLPEERPGILPSPEWKLAAKKEVWFPGETISTGIGQGYTLATPLQMAAATAMLVNRGHWVQPRMVKDVLNYDRSALPEKEWLKKDERAPLTLRDVSLWQSVLSAMEDVVHGDRGTAKSISVGAAYRMAGKTGTAQVFSMKQNEKYDASKIAKELQDHAWFIGYAPAGDPKIVVAVLVENGGHGGSVSAPIARQLFDAYLLGIMPSPNTAEVVSDE